MESYDPASIAVRYKDYTEGTAESFTRAYAHILSEGGPAYRAIFTHVLDHPDKPMLIHCSAGKDRTGVVVALLLSLAGVADEDIAKEYNLTELGLEASGIMESVIAHLVSGPLQGDREGAKRMATAKKESMMTTLKYLRETYGGAEGYLKSQCRITDAEVASIRENLVSDDLPIL